MAGDEVCVYVRLAATQGTYEFRVPFDVSVGQAAQIMACILAARVGPRFCEPGRADLMFVDGPTPGRLLDARASIRGLVLSDELVDGQTLALA